MLKTSTKLKSHAATHREPTRCWTEIAHAFPFDTISFLTACNSNAVNPHRLVASGFKQLQWPLPYKLG